MAEQIDPRLGVLIDDVAEVTGEQRFALCGGVVLDTLLERPINDYDVIIDEQLPSRERVAQLAGRLAINQFAIPVQYRPYFVWVDTPVTLLEAVRDKTVLDIAFMPYDRIGIFTIDSLYVTYPERALVDNYDAMGAYSRREIELARAADGENPFTVAARALKLAAKYDIPLEHAKSLFQELAQLMRQWTPPHEFHVRAYDSARSNTLSAIVRSADQPKFIRSLLEIGILDELFPELIPPLEMLIREEHSNRHYADKLTLSLTLMGLPLETKDRDAFREKLVPNPSAAPF